MSKKIFWYSCSRRYRYMNKVLILLKFVKKQNLWKSENLLTNAHPYDNGSRVQYFLLQHFHFYHLWSRAVITGESAAIPIFFISSHGHPCHPTFPFTVATPKFWTLLRPCEGCKVPRAIGCGFIDKLKKAKMVRMLIHIDCYIFIKLF